MIRIKMGKLSELTPGRVLEKKILARRVAVFNVGGRLVGIESGCKHMGASLASGEVADGVVRCKWHGWRYDLDTGECLNLEGARLKRYQVTVDEDVVYIHM